MSDDNGTDPQFIDTNILLYAYDRSAGIKRDVAAGLLRGLWETRCGRISVQVLQEFYVAATSKVRAPLSRETALRVVEDYGHWRVHSPTVADVTRAAHIQERYQISFWDAMIIQSAARLSCTTLWSEDLNPGQVYEGVTVRNPFASW